MGQLCTPSKVNGLFCRIDLVAVNHRWLLNKGKNTESQNMALKVSKYLRPKVSKISINLSKLILQLRL